MRTFTQVIGYVVVFLSITTCSDTYATTRAPEATKEESTIKHWRVADTEKTFWDIPELNTPYMTTAPHQRADDIRVGSLSGQRKRGLTALAKEIANKQHTEVDSLLIAHKGTLVFESYFSRGRVDLPHPQSSTTKSYTSLAVGRAIALGYLSMDDLKKPIVSLLKSLDVQTMAKGADVLTLQDLLTMSSGIQISEEQTEHYRNHASQYQGRALAQAYLNDTAPIMDNAQSFNYQGQNPDLVMQILDEVVPGPADMFIKRELFGKLGIVNFDWRQDRSGLPSSGSGASVTARDMVKVGQLIMNKGQWQDQQLISPDYIRQAVKQSVTLTAEQAQNFYTGKSLSEPGYGYFWWHTVMNVGDKQLVAKSAQGGGGITIIVIEDLDLVVVVTAHSSQAFLQLVAERVLPLFI